VANKAKKYFQYDYFAAVNTQKIKNCVLRNPKWDIWSPNTHGRFCPLTLTAKLRLLRECLIISCSNLHCWL